MINKGERILSMPIGHPKEKRANDGTLVTSPITIEDHKKFYEGTIYKNNLGQKFVITDYHNADDVGIKFLDEYGYENRVYMSTIPRGAVKNPYTPGKFGCYVGDGPYGRVNDKKAYFVWTDMHQRIYSGKTEGEYRHDIYASYGVCTICDEWHNFQNFAHWYYSYLEKLNPEYEYFIDKDIFQFNILHKVYSPNTCCLVPSDINECISGLYTFAGDLPLGVKLKDDGYYAYSRCIHNVEELGPYLDIDRASKIAIDLKCKMIKELAYSYYINNAITKKVYDALCNLDIRPFPVYDDV
jgi:hypothetical protein